MVLKLPQGDEDSEYVLSLEFFLLEKRINFFGNVENQFIFLENFDETFYEEKKHAFTFDWGPAYH